MLRRFTLVFFVVMIAILAITVPAIAGKPDKVGWKIMFTITGMSGDVTVGANDAGSGFHVFPITGTVNASLPSGYGAVIHPGSISTFSELLSIVPTPQAPKMFDLSWRTYNWEPIGFYQEGNLWPMFKVNGVLTEGGDTTFLDLTQPGSITLMAGYQSELLILANPVPEPASFLALGSGLVGMCGLIARRRRK